MQTIFDKLDKQDSICSVCKSGIKSFIKEEVEAILIDMIGKQSLNEKLDLSYIHKELEIIDIAEKHGFKSRLYK